MADNHFPETHWSEIDRIQNASGEERRERLGAFLEIYRPELMSFLVRKMRLSEDFADDLVQGFICEKILASDGVLKLANQQGRFRNVLRSCLKNFVIDQFKKKHVEVVMDDFEAWVDGGDEEGPDGAWGRAVFQQILEVMRRDSEYWELFVARNLTTPPVPYDVLIREFGFRSPDEASNRLMTAKRQFTRIVNDVLLDHQRDGEDRQDELAKEYRLLRALLNQPEVIQETLDKLRQPAHSGPQSIGVNPVSFVIFDDGNELTDELAPVINHLLRLDLANYISEHSPNSAECTSAVVETLRPWGSFADLLASDEAPFDVLFLVKEHFNVRARTQDSLPSKLNVALYLLHIAACVIRFPNRLAEMTSMNHGQIRQGLRQIGDQEWIPDTQRMLLKKALRCLAE